ncbi:MAG: 3-deoxy-7-phosphoheptulonate synthase, partial [Sphingobacteriaceae bacterium]
MQVVEKIGNYKRDNNVTILQVNRWDEILHKRTSYAKALNLSTDFTEKLLELMHHESIRKQTEIMNHTTVTAD